MTFSREREIRRLILRARGLNETASQNLLRSLASRRWALALEQAMEMENAAHVIREQVRSLVEALEQPVAVEVDWEPGIDCHVQGEVT